MPGAKWYSQPDRPDKRVLGTGSTSHIDDDDLRELLERMLEDLRYLQRTCPNGTPVYGLRAHCWMPDITRRIYGNHNAFFNTTVLSWPHDGKRTIWLPDAVARPGGYIEVVDQAGNAGTTNITIKTIKGQTINGSATFNIDKSNATVQFRSDGENWRSVGASLSALPGTGSGDVTAAANLTDKAATRGDGGAKGISDSDFLIDDLTGGNTLVVGTFDAEGANSHRLTIKTGDTTTSGDSGTLALDTGSAAGTNGGITIGATNASSLTIGRAGVTTTLQGTVALDRAATSSITEATTPILDLNSALSGSNVRKRVFPVRRSVSAGTQIMSWAVGTGENYLFRLRVLRKRTDSGNQSAWQNYSWLVQDIGGTITVTAIDTQHGGVLAAVGPNFSATKGGTPVTMTIGVTAGTEVWNGHIEVEGPLTT